MVLMMALPSACRALNWDACCRLQTEAPTPCPAPTPPPTPPPPPPPPQQRASWRQQFANYTAAAQQPAAKCSYEDFLWAMENVRSRAFSGPYTGSSGAQRFNPILLLVMACWTCRLLGAHYVISIR